MKVFLGGTCAGYPWRDDLQPLLNCEYYNPIVKNWSEEDRLREVHEREISDYVLYGITNSISGVYSIAEVIDDSNKRPEKTIFLNLFEDYGDVSKEKMGHSLKAVENLLKSNGVKVFNNIESVAEFLNNRYFETQSKADFASSECMVNSVNGHFDTKSNLETREPIYIVELHDYDSDTVVGYFTDYKKAEECSDYFNKAKPSSYQDVGFKWQIIEFDPNTIDYASMLNEINEKERLERETKEEEERQKELAELARLKAKYET